uniref:Transmembrane protein 132C n=1 Tax=Loxodonta africana TaxID=9785 RepID=G3T826_LOXAF
QDTEILNTAILTGRTVAMPIKVVSVEENSAVTDISESVECTSTDEDTVKVSDRCDYVFVNGKEMKGKVDAVVNFTYQHLSAPLHITVWVPRLPLQIEVSDTELSQIKGWRVPIMASKRKPLRKARLQGNSGSHKGCSAAGCLEAAPGLLLHRPLKVAQDVTREVCVVLGCDTWMRPVAELLVPCLKSFHPKPFHFKGQIRIAEESSNPWTQVLSPLSDSILGEKTVTVLDDKVAVTDLAIQLVAGLSVTLHPSPNNGKAITAVATAEEQLRTPKQEAVVSTWLQFSDGSATPLDIYDTKDFSLAPSSLNEAIISVSQGRSPRWPMVVAEGEGQGPLVRVDMTIAEACQKFKRKSVLAVGIGNVRVKFGQNKAESSPSQDDKDEEIENHASDRRQKGQDGTLGSPSGGREEGALRKATTTSRSLLDNKAVRTSRLDGGRLPGEGQLQNIPIDFTNFPAQVDAPRAGAGLEESGLVPAPRGLSDLEIGMYALLGVFCLAVLVFLINCATFALKFRHKQVPPEGQTPITHSHDWVWLGNEAELVESVGSPPSPQ